MDNPGWHAQRKAQKEDEERRSLRDHNGFFPPVEQIQPINESFIGGFSPIPSSPPPPPPPKDYFHRLVRNMSENPPAKPAAVRKPSSSSSPLIHMTAVERSRALKTPRMHPHLQFMCGPLLRYDTVDDQGVWNGAALVVTADAGSVYEPHPSLKYGWSPNEPSTNGSSHSPTAQSYDLGSHPADPHSTPNGIHIMERGTNGNTSNGMNADSEQVPGHEIWVYANNGVTFTFWRFSIQIPLGPSEMLVKYTINNGQEFEFFVPGRRQNMRWATYSCNGFSAGLNPDDFRGPGYRSGYDPVWIDLLRKHSEEPFHALVGGGDQLYCDGITREPELQDWVTQPRSIEKSNYPLTEEIENAIDRFYFNHYCQSFRTGAFARANCSIPMMNMCDDHDLIDGFGSYPDELQMSPVFRRIGSRGYFFFLLFQCFINTDVDGTNDEPGQHLNKSIIIGAKGPYVPYPSHSFLGYLGPDCYILLLDCRAERKLDQVCSPLEYQKVFERLKQLPPSTQHLIVQLGIPIAYPRMVFLESALEFKFNPLVALGRAGSLGMSGFVNKFNADAELLDDLNDHWTAKAHKKERNWFIEQLQLFAKENRVRVTFLSGDVHCAAVGVLKTLVKGKTAVEIPAAKDYRFMVNVVTSAIVNTPPPAGVVTMVSTLAGKAHRTMHHAETDESMIPLFRTDTDGSNRKQKVIMARRNWCSVKWDGSNGDLIFDIRVERAKGYGETVSYPLRVPPPGW